MATVDGSLSYGGDGSTNPFDQQYSDAFDFAFTKILGRHAWSFFTRKARLKNPTTVPPEEDYQYNKRFAYPPFFNRMLNVVMSFDDVDHVSMTRIYDGGEGFKTVNFTDYEVRENGIYSNLDVLYIIYQHRDPAALIASSASFRACLVYGVGSFAALNRSAASKLSDSLEMRYQQELRIAMADDKLSYRETSDSPGQFGGLM